MLTDQLSDSSQVDLFADTQTETRNPHVTDTQPDKWVDTNFDFPWMILFQWSGQINPFVLVYLIELDPTDVDGKWLTGVLSPSSRCKHREMKLYPDHAISIFGKVHKGKT